MLCHSIVTSCLIQFLLLTYLLEILRFNSLIYFVKQLIYIKANKEYKFDKPYINVLLNKISMMMLHLSSIVGILTFISKINFVLGGD